MEIKEKKGEEVREESVCEEAGIGRRKREYRRSKRTMGRAFTATENYHMYV